MRAMLTATGATLAAAAVFLALPTEAHALGPVDVELGAKVGYATNPPANSSLFSPNPFGVGAGGRAGVSILGIYAGASFMYYAGGTQSVNESLIGQTTRQHTLQYGVEAGYGFKIATLTLRPQIGCGNLNIRTSFSGYAIGHPVADSTSSSNNVYVEPGVTALVSIGPVFVGGDVNVLFAPGEQPSNQYPSTPTTYVSFTSHGQAGIKL